MARLSASQRESREIIAAAVGVARDPYLRAIAAEIEGLPAAVYWHDFRGVLGRAIVLSQLVGLAASTKQAKLLGADLPFDDQAIAQQDVDRFVRVEPLFEVGAFLEAIRGFDDRVPRLRTHVERLIRGAQALSTSIAESEQAEVVNLLATRSGLVQQVVRGSFFVTDADETTIINLKSLLADAMRGGISTDEAGELLGVSLPDFIDQAQVSGAVNLARARLETIYRNNLNSAFNEAQVDALRGQQIRRIIPLLMLNEIRDRRTRGNPNGINADRGFHWQMNGFVGTAEEFDQFGITPPNGHNCRGGVRGLSATESKRMGFVDDNGELNIEAIRTHNGDRLRILQQGLYPDPGFQTVGVAA